MNTEHSKETGATPSWHGVTLAESFRRHAHQLHRVRRRHLGRLSNDIGFRRTERGLAPVVSEYDETAVRVGDRPFLVALKTAINTRKARELARRFGGRLTERRINGALVIRAMR